MADLPSATSLLTCAIPNSCEKRHPSVEESSPLTASIRNYGTIDEEKDDREEDRAVLKTEGTGSRDILESDGQDVSPLGRFSRTMSQHHQMFHEIDNYQIMECKDDDSEQSDLEWQTDSLFKENIFSRTERTDDDTSFTCSEEDSFTVSCWVMFDKCSC